MTVSNISERAIVAAERAFPVRVIANLVKNWQLIWQFLHRDISMRYRGTFFGIFWSFLSPLLMLAVYAFVFGFIFKSRFAIDHDEGPLDFSLGLFCGLNLFNLLAEVVTRSPTIILQYPNFVKKVVFPLEVLPVVTTGTAVFHCLIAFVPLALGLGLVHQQIPFTVLFLFLYLIPLALLACGSSWILAAVGVFFRDIQPVLTVAITVLMFTSAIFYPLNAVPENLRAIICLNPMVHLVQNARAAIIWAVMPDWRVYFLLLAGSLAVFLGGYFVFERSKPAFADVL
jgi:lipopolysaccharide transport system permease protein